VLSKVELAVVVGWFGLRCVFKTQVNVYSKSYQMDKILIPILYYCLLCVSHTLFNPNHTASPAFSMLLNIKKNELKH
jgi:hypothetical protein